MDSATILIYDKCLGKYVYIKYATESHKTGDLNKLYITCQHAGHLFKFKHNMSRGSFSWHILPTYIVVRRSVSHPAASSATKQGQSGIPAPSLQRVHFISYHISVLQAHSLLTALDGSPLCCKCMQCGWGGGFLFCAACVEFIRRPT